MSALRISRPGHPTRYVPLGPASPGYASHGGSYGGPIVAERGSARPVSTRQIGTKPATQQKRIEADRPRPRCWLPMKNVPGERCGRLPGHKPGACRSEWVVEEDRRLRREKRR